MECMSTATPGHTHHAIDYIEITVRDVGLAKAFYTSAFGWRFSDYGPDYAGIQGPERAPWGIHGRLAQRLGRADGRAGISAAMSNRLLSTELSSPAVSMIIKVSAAGPRSLKRVSLSETAVATPVSARAAPRT